MNIIKTDIPDVLIFEPRVFGDARGFFFESFSSKVFNEAVGRQVEFVQTTIPSPRKAYCAGCTISWIRTLRASWSAVWKVRCLMWQWISVVHRLPLVNGWARCSAQRINVSCGSRKDSPTGLWRWATRCSLSIRRRTTTRRSQNGASSGTIRR